MPVTVYSFTLLGSCVKVCDPQAFSGPFISYIKEVKPLHRSFIMKYDHIHHLPSLLLFLPLVIRVGHTIDILDIHEIVLHNNSTLSSCH